MLGLSITGSTLTYRNPKLLVGAKGAPCQSCGSEDYTTVAAHSNQSRDGRGYAHKSADYRVAYLCMHCHDLVDGRAGALTRAEKVDLFEAAHRRTIGYIFESGIVK